MKVLEKYSFEKDFIDWIKILLQNQESCVVNRGTTTNYFKLEKRYYTRRPNFCILVYTCFRNSILIY